MSGGRLGVAGALAGLAGSYVGLVLVLALVAQASDSVEYWSAIVAVATPTWIVAMLVIGLPAAWWIERRLPAGASFGRRYRPYLLAGLASGLLAAAMFLVALGTAMAVLGFMCAFAAALGGRAGLDLWRRWDARDADARTGS